MKDKAKLRMLNNLHSTFLVVFSKINTYLLAA